eukprot:TRINITY_DN48281_c0_g1_i1.p1 TRINITY_DN48281_c0_g1~~TRINITY_DN48281_c0_g1_i1.p1  ORF type:complete len:842 (+),score=101.02 TRINITY_DN48281_c0_g1_i1:61-2586(+)
MPVAPCHCPDVWEEQRASFLAAIDTNHTHGFVRALSQFCWHNIPRVNKIMRGTFETAFDGDAHSASEETTCGPGVLLTAYACVIASFVGYLEFDNEFLLKKFRATLYSLLLTYGHCLVEVNRWRLSAGQVIRQLEHMTGATRRVRVCGKVARWGIARALRRLLAEPAPLCAGAHDRRKPIAGSCADAIGHQVVTAAVEPVDRISPDSVVMCTHTSLGTLGMLERQLVSWGSAASIAILMKPGDDVQHVHRWYQQWAKLKSLRSLSFSLVFETKPPRNAYDRRYPANLLRQVAVNASAADIVLVVDPGFLPSAGLAISLEGSLKAVVRTLLQRMVVLVFSAFEVYDADGDLTLSELKARVISGVAASFDRLVCPICRPYGWQWLLMEADRRPLQFRGLGLHDLHHPVWLAKRSALWFEPHLRGVAGGAHFAAARSATNGWLELPRGLRASADKVVAGGYLPAMVPGHFFWRPVGDKLLDVLGDSGSQDAPHWSSGHPSHEDFGAELLYRRFLASFPAARNQAPEYSFSVAGEGGDDGSVTAEVVAEVVPYRRATDFLVTLRGSGRSNELQVVVVASTIVGSPELDRLVMSLPWPVHAVGVGGDVLHSIMVELPQALRAFNDNELILISDAYDVMAMQCQRSIVSEFRAFDREVVLAAETGCWRGGRQEPCASCESRYAVGSEEIQACQAGFPFVNAGGILGTVASLTRAFTWMQGVDLGVGDVQGAWWQYYDAFPDRVALDHRQRIWAVVGGLRLDKFRVLGGGSSEEDVHGSADFPCGRVLNGYTGEEVCIMHANSNSRRSILIPLEQEIARVCGKPPPRPKPKIWAGLWAEPEKSMPRYL